MDIPYTLSCEKCGTDILDFVTPDNIPPGSDPDVVKLSLHDDLVFVLRLREPGHVYRVFCAACGEATTKNIGKGLLFGLEPGENCLYHNPNYGSLSPFADVQPPRLSKELRTSGKHHSGIADCAISFSSNLINVRAMAEVSVLSAGLSNWSQIYLARLFGIAEHERRENRVSIGENLDSEFTKDYVRNYVALHRLSTESLTPEDLANIREHGAVVVNKWTYAHPRLRAGVRAVLLSQITLAWTAIEMLAADLWIAAVNERPNPLATNFARSVQHKAQDKSIPLTALAKYGDHDFNLQRMMGRILHDEKKVDFTSLESTAFAYEKAFGRRFAALDSDDLKLLELVRNLILHRAGIVDPDFIDRIADKGLAAHPFCAAAKPKETFKVNRAVATQLASSAKDAGMSLLNSVCDFLWPDPPPEDGAPPG